jgi:cell division protein FtsA
MSKENIIVGIDVGSTATRAIIAQDVSGAEIPRIIGVGIVPSFGIRRGVIVDMEEVVKVINEAVVTCERMAGINAKEAIVSVGGPEITFQNSKGVIAIGRADGEVTEEDLSRVLNEAQAVPIPLNKEIIHIIPQSYRLDDQENIKDPLGMKGVRLEVNALIIEASSTHLKNLTKCVNQAGIEIEELVLAPLASAKSVITKKQKELGSVLINIGGGTTSLAVFEEGDLIHTAILPLGAGHITNDIAIGLRTSIEVAEKIKLEYGSAIAEEISKREEIDLSQFDSQEVGTVLRHHVAEIIEARLEEIFMMANKELKSIGKAGLLPAGAILTGGGAKMPQIIDLAKNILGLPTQIGFPVNLGGMMDRVDDPSFSTVVGLVLWARERMMFTSKKGIFNNISLSTGGTMKKMKGWIGKFLP